MTATTSSIIATAPVDADVMVKRLFKVAELLARHADKPDDSLAENEYENHVPQEIEYRESEDQQRHT